VVIGGWKRPPGKFRSLLAASSRRSPGLCRARRHRLFRQDKVAHHAALKAAAKTSPFGGKDAPKKEAATCIG
jgi:hypothetical protein